MVQKTSTIQNCIFIASVYINCCVLIQCHIFGFCNNLFHSMQQANKPIQLLELVVLWQLIGVWYQCPRQSWWILPNQIIPCIYTNTITYCWKLLQYHSLGCWNTIIHYHIFCNHGSGVYNNPKLYYYCISLFNTHLQSNCSITLHKLLCIDTVSIRFKGSDHEPMRNLMY